MIRQALVAAVLCAIAALPACSRKPKAEAEALKRDDINLVVSTEYAPFVEPTEFDKNFGVHARAIGQRVVVSFRNSTQYNVLVGPVNVAIIKGPNKQTDLVPLRPPAIELGTFAAPLTLRPGDKGVREFMVRDGFDPLGKKLVFRAPDQGIMFLVPIVADIPAN